MTATPGQGEEHWKNRYYDQLDRLEKKEKEWAGLESVLKRTVGRLTLAAEGQDEAIDRHITEIRAVIKNDIDRFRLESILEELSKRLAKIEQSQSSPDQQVIDCLQALLEPLEFPEPLLKEKQKLIKRLSNTTDKEKTPSIQSVLELLKKSLALQSGKTAKKTGFLDRILGATDTASKTVDVQATATIIMHIVELIPWPKKYSEQVHAIVGDAREIKTDKALSTRISQLEKIIKIWKTENQEDISPLDDIRADGSQSISELSPQHQADLEIYRSYVMSFLDGFNENSSISEQLSALRVVANDAIEKSELDGLAVNLAKLLMQSDFVQAKPIPPDDVISSSGLTKIDTEVDVQPNIQELLIRLLEQLVVPSDFHKHVEDMKSRLEKKTQLADWKPLLKDVAALINSIRISMQNEKHEFESFLQQVTSRLKEMDNFLQNESLSVDVAEQEGKIFDVKVKGHVKDIRNDMKQASDLEDLKGVVESRLENISLHIKEYREAEHKRFINVKKDVFEMQNQMMTLEQESENLKIIIIEKNKQAMFDVLTEIPNRLAYEKKSAEEIARWKRFSNPLSLAIWDIDFFKKVNDSYGHKAGDKVLRTIAQLLNDRVRETDFLARFGGEEFVMLLPGTMQDEALNLANDLRNKIENCNFHYKGNAVPITVSCGISAFSEGDNLESVFERADIALYKAKENGRNQCVIAS